MGIHTHARACTRTCTLCATALAALLVCMCEWDCATAAMFFGGQCWLDGRYDDLLGMRIPNKSKGNEN